MDVLIPLIFLFAFVRFTHVSPQQVDAALKLVDGALWSATFLVLVERLLNFGLEVIRLSA